MNTIGQIFTAFVALWTSRKLWMTLLAVSIMYGLFWHGVYWLVNGVPTDKVAAFESMFQTTQITIAGAILGYLGVQGWQNVFSRSASSVAANIVERVISKSDVSITENVDPAVVSRFAQQYASDPSYRPIQPGEV